MREVKKAHSYGQISERRRPFKRPGHKWNDNTKCQKMRVGVNGAHLILAVQVPMVGSCEHGQASQGLVNMGMHLRVP